MPPTLVDALRQHLIDQNVGRDPRVAGPLPPIWREKDALPAPTEGNATEAGAHAVIGLYQTGGIPAESGMAWLERPVVDIWIRADTSVLGKTIGKQVRDALITRQPAPARTFDMGGLPVIDVQEWRALQPVTPPTQGWTYTISFLLHLYA